MPSSASTASAAVELEATARTAWWRRSGRDIALPDLLVAVVSCDRRRDFTRPCGARYTDLAGSAAVAEGRRCIANWLGRRARSTSTRSGRYCARCCHSNAKTRPPVFVAGSIASIAFLQLSEIVI